MIPSTPPTGNARAMLRALAAIACLPFSLGSALVPRRVAFGAGDWRHKALEALWTEGAVVVADVGDGGEEDFKEAALRLPRQLFAERPKLLSADAPVSGVHEELLEAKRRGKYLPGSGLLPHTDGYVYGDFLPDFVTLLCEEPSVEGGANTLLDGVALARTLDQEALHWLETTPVDLSEADASGIAAGRKAEGPVIQWPSTSTGERRLKWRRQINVEEAKRTRNWHPLDASGSAAEGVAGRYVSLWKPLPNATEAEAKEIRRNLAELDGRLQSAFASAEREGTFSLARGEALVIDNWRVLHSRGPYKGTRKMWRVWSWTSEGSGLPPGGAKTSQPLSEVFDAPRAEL
ncbi:unnamed protein product [Effrenium voratum]|uniref:TauD/TfdA-like domain-containing protein n=1 Tax=Effrenium voratum TaxID=2562239 RepID=A0AA36NLT9_9DINO|nr:unnamed protein product [Effrenium voratum]